MSASSDSVGEKRVCSPSRPSARRFDRSARSARRGSRPAPPARPAARRRKAHVLGEHAERDPALLFARSLRLAAPRAPSGVGVGVLAPASARRGQRLRSIVPVATPPPVASRPRTPPRRRRRSPRSASAIARCALVRRKAAMQELDFVARRQQLLAQALRLARDVLEVGVARRGESTPARGRRPRPCAARDRAGRSPAPDPWPLRAGRRAVRVCAPTGSVPWH